MTTNAFTCLELGISALFLYMAWRLYCRAALDRLRDSLFDLRDGLWEYFEERGDLNNPLHKELRAYLNHYIFLRTKDFFF